MLFMLIRHAIAEERGMKPDGLRALTEEGRQKIEAAYPRLCDALKDYTVRLISSPLVRAYQTAEELEKHLDVKMELQDWVAIGDTRELYRAMAETKEDILILVGHEPTFSDWCDLLGFPVGWMKKGSVAFFEIGEEVTFLDYLTVKDLTEKGEIPLLYALRQDSE